MAARHDFDVFRDVVMSTDAARSSVIDSNIEDTNAFLKLLKDKGRIETIDGGAFVQRGVELSENETIQNYAPGQQLNTAGGRAPQAAKFDWSLKSMHITQTGYELRTNRTQKAWINLAKSKMEQAKTTATNRLGLELHGDGTIRGSFPAIRAAIRPLAVGSTGVWGGISSNAFPNWNNRHLQSPPVDVSPAKIRRTMSTLKLRCSIGGGPKVIVCTNDIYLNYEESIVAQVRYMDAKKADGNVGSLVHDGCEILHDYNSDFAEDGQTALQLDYKKMRLVQHEHAKMEAEKDRVPVNQDAVVIPFYGMFCFELWGRRNHGLLTVS